MALICLIVINHLMHLLAHEFDSPSDDRLLIIITATKSQQSWYLESFEELFGGDASAWVDSQFHLTDLLVDLLHEVNDEVY